MQWPCGIWQFPLNLTRLLVSLHLRVKQTETKKKKNTGQIEKYWSVTHLKEGHGGTVLYHPIFYLRLLRQVISRVNGWLHSLYSEEGSQVCRIGGDDDKCEKPPNPPHNSGGEGFRHELRSWMRGAEEGVRPDMSLQSIGGSTQARPGLCICCMDPDIYSKSRQSGRQPV